MKYRCRAARFSDLDRPDFKALVLRGLLSGAKSADIDMRKVVGQARQIIAGPQNHAAIAERGGVMVAYLAAMRVQTWGPRDRILVLGWYSEAPGAGMALLRDLFKAVKSGGGVVDVLLTVHADPGQRLARALERLGACVVPTFILRL